MLICSEFQPGSLQGTRASGSSKGKTWELSGDGSCKVFIRNAEGEEC